MPRSRIDRSAAAVAAPAATTTAAAGAISRIAAMAEVD
eukprot:COSAG02_NODE_1100_length_14582_cov_130.690672_10_plen_38_part_00